MAEALLAESTSTVWACFRNVKFKHIQIWVVFLGTAHSINSLEDMSINLGCPHLIMMIISRCLHSSDCHCHCQQQSQSQPLGVLEGHVTPFCKSRRTPPCDWIAVLLCQHDESTTCGGVGSDDRRRSPWQELRGGPAIHKLDVKARLTM